jgi:hypothetical protein
MVIGELQKHLDVNVLRFVLMSNGCKCQMAYNTDIYATSVVYTPKIEIYTQLIITYF